MVLLTIAFVSYISIFLFFRAYQIGVQKRLNLITDWSGNQLPNPENHRTQFIKLYLIASVILILTTIALITFKVPLINWWPLGFIGFFAASYRNYISKSARGEVVDKKPNDRLDKLANYHIVILVLFLLFFLFVLLAGILLLIIGKGESVWKLLMCGTFGVALATKVILIKYDKSKLSS